MGRWLPFVLLGLLGGCDCGSEGGEGEGEGEGEPDAAQAGPDGGEADAGQEPACIPAGPEICNGVDDDCAAGIDEGYVLSCVPCADGTEGCVDATLRGPGWRVGLARNLLVGNDIGIALPPLPVASEALYVSNSDEDTVSKIRIRDGLEVARFATGDNPSRTAVDGNGDAWIALRGSLYDTREDPLDDGLLKIDGACTPVIAPPIPTRECILLDVPNVGNLMRGLAVDAKGDVWVGSYLTGEVIHLDGDTGLEMDRIELDPACTPYGLAIDQDGYLWISGFDAPARVERLDPVLGVVDVAIDSASIDEAYSYGIAVDDAGGVWFGTIASYVFRVDTRTFEVSPLYPQGGGASRGVAIDERGALWIADSVGDRLLRMDTTTHEITAEVPVAAGPVGVASDPEGNIWAASQTGESVTKISPEGDVLLSTPVGRGPYTYSDMTGAAFRIFRTMRGIFVGTYTVGWDDAHWTSVAWAGNLPPPSELSLRVRAANGDPSLAEWQDVALGEDARGALSVTGSHLEVEVTLSTADRSAEPNLSSLVFRVEP